MEISALGPATTSAKRGWSDGQSGGVARAGATYPARRRHKHGGNRDTQAVDGFTIGSPLTTAMPRHSSHRWSHGIARAR